MAAISRMLQISAMLRGGAPRNGNELIYRQPRASFCANPSSLQLAASAVSGWRADEPWRLAKRMSCASKKSAISNASSGGGVAALKPAGAAVAFARRARRRPLGIFWRRAAAAEQRETVRGNAIALQKQWPLVLAREYDVLLLLAAVYYVKESNEVKRVKLIRTLKAAE